MHHHSYVAVLFPFLLAITGCREAGVGARPGMTPDSDALEDRLIALGSTGARESLAFIPHYLYHPSDDVRKAAKKALRKWRKANGQPIEQVPVDWQIELQSPSADERGDVCDRIRKHGLAATAVPYVLPAAQQERNPGAQRRMLLLLGVSGTPEARRTIDAMLASADDDTRDSARKALALWQKAHEPRTNRGALAAGIVAGVLVGLAAADAGSSASAPFVGPPMPNRSPAPPPPSSGQRAVEPSESEDSSSDQAKPKGKWKDDWTFDYDPCANTEMVCKGGYDSSGTYNGCQTLDVQCRAGMKPRYAPKYVVEPER